MCSIEDLPLIFEWNLHQMKYLLIILFVSLAMGSCIPKAGSDKSQETQPEETSDSIDALDNGSKTYSEQIVGKWAAGEYYKALFLKSADEENERLRFTQTFSKEK